MIEVTITSGTWWKETETFLVPKVIMKASKHKPSVHRSDRLLTKGRRVRGDVACA